MPTKKRRIGFIPRRDVLDLINKLSYESNLSNSKIINILVEEALHNRGIFSIEYCKVLNYKERLVLNNENRIKINNTENQNNTEAADDFIDKEIYAKFLMFLQFQEKMKKRNFN